MTTRNPLFYQSSKCVALYLDANIRFQLFLQCPGIRSVYNTQPVRIHELKVRPNNFQINGTVFSVGIIRKYSTTTPTPESVKLRNADGGIHHDVDRYGIRSDGREEGNQEMAGAMRDATQLNFLEALLEFMVRDGERQRCDMEHDWDLWIEARQLEILSYRMRISNQEPPFTQYLQLTITTGTVQKVERVEYDKNLKFTRDYILGKIFGVVKVQVGSLQIGEDKFNSRLGLHHAEDEEIVLARPGNAFDVYTLSGQIEPLLPVPEGKLEIAEMRVTGNLKNALTSIKTSLSENPLKKLTCAYQPFPDGPVLQNAEILCIAGPVSLKVFNGNLNNNRIHLRSCNIMQTDFMNLVNKWTTEKNEVGRFYSIEFRQEKGIKRFIKMFRNLPVAERGENDESRLSQYRECIIIPMRDETELNVWCERTNENDKAYCDNKFIAKIKVQHSGYARVH
ncbi:hypothetical protein GCK72_004130 [Caenorhabditis remanei]|uniref:Uncharacterized protein n=1 Tax=Caenorhabditis remanei TaxID=31234 RepID=A0A6A5HCT9_CAERE|nr:hypothetical protein GCK72_004130 [Caenorhabditis remanei]KAF1764183.1 hypothetical protein GCK72_004130 [Caenorhabditis remanei]